MREVGIELIPILHLLEDEYYNLNNLSDDDYFKLREILRDNEDNSKLIYLESKIPVYKIRNIKSFIYYIRDKDKDKLYKWLDGLLNE